MNASHQTDGRVYWPQEAIRLLETGAVDEISLDHDLGDDERGTGYDVVRWIEEAVELRGFEPAAFGGGKRCDELRQPLRIGGENRDGLLEGFLVGDDGHAVILGEVGDATSAHPGNCKRESSGHLMR